MNEVATSKRRDPRFHIQPGTAAVEFEYAGPAGNAHRGDVIEISAAGLCFALDFDPGLEIGTLLVAVSVDIGSCLFDGDLRVSSTRAIDGSRVALGCLFYPASEADSERWMALIAGARVTRGG